MQAGRRDICTAPGYQYPEISARVHDGIPPESDKFPRYFNGNKYPRNNLKYREYGSVL
jgi:hypothetical protein